jgi:NACalpha-BTF3-like transcription factor
MSPFDFLNAINATKENLFEDPQAVKDYRKGAFIVNRGLSEFPDTIMYANQINQHYYIPPEWQFSFYLNSIPKKRRFKKDWAKKEAKSDSLKLVMEYYKYSAEKAKQALSVLTQEQLTMIEEKLYKGGK